MQLMRDSVQPVKESVNTDTFIWKSVIGRDSVFHAKETFINIYNGHELKPKHRTTEPLNHDKGDWLFFLVLMVAAVFAYLRLAYRKYLDRMFNALFNINITNQIVRDDNMLVQRASLLLNFIFYAVA